MKFPRVRVECVVLPPPFPPLCRGGSALLFGAAFVASFNAKKASFGSIPPSVSNVAIHSFIFPITAFRETVGERATACQSADEKDDDCVAMLEPRYRDCVAKKSAGESRRAEESLPCDRPAVIAQASVNTPGGRGV